MSNIIKPKALILNELDNVAVLLSNTTTGDELSIGDKCVVAGEAISIGHKIAVCDIKKGDRIIKYGLPIGVACEDIKIGTWVHVHNVFDNTDELCHEFEEKILKDTPEKECNANYKSI